MQSMIGLVLGLGLMLLYVYSDSIYPGIFASFALRCFLYLEQSNPQLFEPLAQFFVQGGEIQTFALQLIVLGFLSIAVGLCLKCKPMENKERNLYRALDEISKKYGKNKVLKGSSLTKESTIKERHNQIGGHRR